MLATSQRPFLPPNLSNPMMGGMSFPLGGGRMLPPNPSPVAQAQAPHTDSADANGIQTAMAKRGAQDSSADRLSSTGTKSGVTYKTDEDGSKTGTSAFDTLDGYMKKAGLNSFQTRFFTGLAEKGLDEDQVRTVVKTAGERFGPEVGLELEQGMAQLEKVALPWGNIARTAWGMGRKALGYGAKQVAKAPAAVKNTAQAVKNVAPKVIPKAKQIGQTPVGTAVANTAKAVAKPVTTKLAPAASKLAPAAAKLAPAGRAVAATGRGLKNFAASPAGANTGLGALTGAMNPWTGLPTDAQYNADGSFNWNQLLRNSLAGGLAGRFGGATGRQMMLRSGAGESAGYLGGNAANLVGDLTGNETLQNISPQGLAQWGAGLGAASKFVPGMRGTGATDKILRAEPVGAAARTAWRGAKATPGAVTGTARAVGNAVRARPGMAATLGAAGLGAGYVGNEHVKSMRAVADAARNTPEMVQSEVQKLKDEYQPQVQRLLDQGNEAVAGVNKATGKANEMLGGGLGGMLGGEGGWGGILSGLMSGEGGGLAGDIGGYLKKNPWLLPLLLGGLGAGGGYMMGGKGGAALGGIGAPLLYALATGQLGTDQAAASGGGPAAAEAATQKAKEDATIKEQQRSGNIAKVPEAQKAPENEVTRQQKQQAAGANPRLGSVMIPQ